VSGVFGPPLASYISTSVIEGKDGIRRLNEIIFNFNIKRIWFIIPVLIAFITLTIISNFLIPLFDSDFVPRHFINPWYGVFPLFIMMIFGGGLEELGWRATALPELEKKFSPILSSIVIWIVWAFWHLPLFFIKGINQYHKSIAVFFLGVLGITLILTWLFNRTKSIAVCVIFHASINTIGNMGFVVMLVDENNICAGIVSTSILIITGIILNVIDLRKDRNLIIVQGDKY